MQEIAPTEDILAHLAGQFIVETKDRIEQIEDALEMRRSDTMDNMEVLSEIRRIAHSIKGTGASFGYPMITTVSHRLEDYLDGLEDLSERHIRDCFRFTEILQELVERGTGLDKNAEREYMQLLPAKWFPFINVELGRAEVLVAINSAVLKRALERELCSLGYRVVGTNSSIDLLQLTLSMSPNAVIVAAEMKGLPGLDVARALGAMHMTRDIPVGLLTSYAEEDLDEVPENTVIIHKEAQGFATGLANLAARIKVDKIGQIVTETT